VAFPAPSVVGSASLVGPSRAASTSPAAAPAPAVRVTRGGGEPRSAALEGDEAAQLFGAAERARGDGDWEEARHLFGALASRFRGTREELTARVLRGQMLLDALDEPAAALRAFELYLRDEPTGALAEEALVGRAQALRRLGRAADEAEAWRELLALHPRSVHAEVARERLDALGRGD
jgi:outer membrane protein assembly factor BamD (BamD/ComL family)